MHQTRYPIGGLVFPALITFLLIVVQAASRPSTENENDLSDIAALPPDVDNVEFHHVKIVDGIIHEEHPVVMYKEDFVSEDYDPNKNETSENHPKKYKHQRRFRHHHSKLSADDETVVKQEVKIMFDVLPEQPILLSDDSSSADHFEASQLLQPSKVESSHKYPKKHHSRQRRQIFNPYALPNYVTHPRIYYQSGVSKVYLPTTSMLSYQRYPVIGKKPKYRGKLPYWQTEKPTRPVMTIDNRDNFGEDNGDSLFHNSNPEDADFSIFNKPRPDNNKNSDSSSGNNINQWQSPPVEEPQESQPIWGPSIGRRPSGSQVRQTTTSTPAWSRQTTRRPVQPQQSPVTSSPPRQQASSKVSNCVWAIVNCCSQDSTRIRYNCFEEFGCHGAFWGVNPCTDQVRDGNVAIVGGFGNTTPKAQQSQPATSWTSSIWSRPQSRPREDTLQYPVESSKPIGSACQRASRLCCSLGNLGSQYDCFHHQQCQQSISDIVAACY